MGPGGQPPNSKTEEGRKRKAHSPGKVQSEGRFSAPWDGEEGAQLASSGSPIPLVLPMGFPCTYRGGSAGQYDRMRNIVGMASLSLLTV